MEPDPIIEIRPTRPAKSRPKVYSVPRRYDLATLLVVMTAGTMLFGVLRLLRLEPVWFALVAGFFACVGLAQALLFRGKSPRAASMIAGAGYWVVAATIASVDAGNFEENLMAAWCGALPAAILGYVAGVAVGSVFLMADLARHLARVLRGG